MNIDQHTEGLLSGWLPLTLDEINAINEIQRRGPRLMRHQGLRYRIYAARLSNRRHSTTPVYLRAYRKDWGGENQRLPAARSPRRKGILLGDAAVTKGRVLYLAGENPDDIRMRLHCAPGANGAR